MGKQIPTLLLCTRFGLGIHDRRWFEHRLRLIEAVTAASLASQTCQDFIWTIFIDPDLDPAIRAELERIVSAVGHSVLCDEGMYTTQSVFDLTATLGLSQNGYILTGRIDDDDAWSRDTVELVYSHLGDWLNQHAVSRRPGAALTFAQGLEWLMYDMVDIDQRAKGRHIVRRQALRPYRYPFLGTSVFVLAAEELGVTAISTSHSKIADTLPALGIDLLVDEEPTEMWLYARHKQSVSSIQKARADSRGVDVGELATRFGLNPELVKSYIDTADEFGYVVEKRTVARRSALTRELRELNKMLEEPDLNSEEAQRIHDRRSALLDEMDRISRHLVAEVEAKTT